MELSLFDYEFPKDLVAQHPLPQREDSRLMILNRKNKTWEHRQFPDLLDYLHKGDLMVFNNALADLVLIGDRVVPALPPYIKRKKPEDFTDEDFQRYRTIYGQVPGSKAAPTAGFHFSEEILSQIKSRGIETAFVTLHVNYDTYKPIRSQNILEHPMHGEEYIVPQETAEKVVRAKKDGRRVIAVGTTTVRALESWTASRVLKSVIASPKGAAISRVHREIASPPPADRNDILPTRIFTTLYITPGFPFQIVDAVLTNFHRPRSTVLVMVSAFAGRDFIFESYTEAIRERYRLFSYGDAMLIL